MTAETPLDLDAIEKRRAAITPPPWRIGQSVTHGPSAITRDAEGLPTVQDLWVADVDAESGNATFIARAPEDIDALIAEVRTERARREQAEAVLRGHATACLYKVERDALQARIDAAPHAIDCGTQRPIYATGDGLALRGTCTCWKSAALAGDQPAATPEPKLTESPSLPLGEAMRSKPKMPRLDPYPYHCGDGPSCRHSRKLSPHTVFDPRPGYSRNRADYEEQGRG